MRIMRKYLIGLLLAVLLVTPSYPEIPSDKLMHMLVGTGIYGVCLLAGEIYPKLNTTTCLIPVVVAGVGKELYDSKHPETHTADYMDAVATIAIPVTGSIILYEW